MKKKVIIFALLLASLLISSAALPKQAIAQDEDPETNPWVFQNWCLEHLGCGRYGIHNYTNGWLQIYLTDHNTGQKGFFTVPPKGPTSDGYEFITLRPGNYQAKYVYWCGGDMRTFEINWPLNQFWTDIFRCPQGYAGSIRR